MDMETWSSDSLRAFEADIANLFNIGEIRAPIHLSDGNEIQMIEIFQEIKDESLFDLIYFDAFGFRVQPELWSEEIFVKMFEALKPNGVLVTYACRTTIKNAMLSAGFSVEKLPGAPGKREMLRATKEVSKN